MHELSRPVFPARSQLSVFCEQLNDGESYRIAKQPTAVGVKSLVSGSRHMDHALREKVARVRKHSTAVPSVGETRIISLVSSARGNSRTI